MTTEIEIGRGKRGRRSYAFDDVAVVRVEQLYPFNSELFHDVTAPYREAAEALGLNRGTLRKKLRTYSIIQ